MMSDRGRVQSTSGKLVWTQREYRDIYFKNMAFPFQFEPGPVVFTLTLQMCSARDHGLTSFQQQNTQRYKIKCLIGDFL